MSTPVRARMRGAAAALRAAALTVALVVPLAPALLQAPASADAITPLSVDLVGKYSDSDTSRGYSREAVSGVVASTWRSSGSVTTATYGFSFDAPCTAAGTTTAAAGPSCASISTAGQQLYWHWDFGDGRTATTTSSTPGGPVVYTRPGAYQVTVTVDDQLASGTRPSVAYAGVGHLEVLVSPRYADAGPATSAADGGGTGTKGAASESAAIWTVGALGLLPSCGSYVPSGAWSFVEDPGVTPRATDPGRSLFCPDPNPNTYYSYDPNSANTASRMVSANGVTGASCVSSPSACGLPVEVFVESSPTQTAEAACTSTCLTRLQNLGLIDGSNRMTYNPLVCEDNQTKTRYAYPVISGVEDGCVTYGDYMTALARALDGGPTDPTAELAAGCATETTPIAVRRAAFLLSTSPAAGTVTGAVRVCGVDAALTKSEAYALTAAAAGLLPSSSSQGARTLRDLSSAPNLAWGPATTAAFPDYVSALLTRGTPLVGSLACPDRRLRQSADQDPGACFNGGQALHRDDAALLLASLLPSPPATSAGLVLEVRPTTITATLGAPRSINVDVYTPAWYPDTAMVSVSWAASPYGAVRCPASQGRVGAAHQVSLTCTFTPTSDPGAAGANLTVTATDDQAGASVSKVVSLAVANSAPLISDPVVAANPLEGSAPTLSLDYYDAQGNPVTAGVRSCLPARDAACYTAAATFPRDQNLPRTSTNDTGASQFVKSANTDVGTVKIVSTTSSSINLSVAPADPDNNGPVDFVVQLCDSGNACVTKYVRFDILAVNDAPSAVPLSVYSVGSAGKTITLTGSDPQDTPQPGYPGGGPIQAYRVCTIPAGWSGTWGGGAALASAVASSDPRLTLSPQAGTASGSYTFTYQVQDVGASTPSNTTAWSGSSCPNDGSIANVGQLVVNYDAASAPAVGVTSSPAQVAAFSDDEVVTIAGASSASQVLVDWGDGTTTGPTISASVKHRYTPTTTTTYPVTYKVVDATGTMGPAQSAGSVQVLANYMANPTFESPRTGWSAAPDTTSIGRVSGTEGGHGGDAALKVAQSSGASGTCVAQTPVGEVAGRTQKGKTYQATVWLKTPEAQSAQLTVYEATPQGAVVSSAVQAPVTTSATTWTKLSFPETATIDGAALLVKVSVARPSSGTVCTWLDDVSVTGQMTTTPATVQSTVLADGPWAYYPMDSPSSADSNLYDFSGNGRHIPNRSTPTPNWYNLTSGGAPIPVSSQFSTTIGAGGSLNAPVFTDGAGGIAPQVGDQWSYELWFTKDAALTSAGATLLSPSGSSAGGSQKLEYVPISAGGAGAGMLGFTSFGTQPVGTQVMRGISWSSIPDGPVHLVAVFTRGADTTADTLYVNGVKQTLTGTAGTLAKADAVNTVQVGSPGLRLDEVAFYVGALPASSVATHFQAGSSPAVAAVAADAPVASLTSWTPTRASTPASRARVDSAVRDGSFSVEAWVPDTLEAGFTTSLTSPGATFDSGPPVAGGGPVAAVAGLSRALGLPPSAPRAQAVRLWQAGPRASALLSRDGSRLLVTAPDGRRYAADLPDGPSGHLPHAVDSALTGRQIVVSFSARRGVDLVVDGTAVPIDEVAAAPTLRPAPRATARPAGAEVARVVQGRFTGVVVAAAGGQVSLFARALPAERSLAHFSATVDQVARYVASVRLLSDLQHAQTRAPAERLTRARAEVAADLALIPAPSRPEPGQ